MTGRPAWEVLIGSPRTLDYLAEPAYNEPPHPLQELMEEFVETQLTEDEQELFRLRFGEQTPIRVIARIMGYTSHQVIQVKIQRIVEKAREYIERATVTGNA